MNNSWFRVPLLTPATNSFNRKPKASASIGAAHHALAFGLRLNEVVRGRVLNK